MPRRIVTALLLILAAYGAVCLAAWGLQRKVMYFPGPVLPTPADAGLPEATILRVVSERAGGALTHWYVPPPDDQARVIVHFHGNAGTIADRVPVARSWIAKGYGFLLVEYPGYGGNPGAPSEESLFAAARGALAALEQKGIPPERWILIGESLGGAVAVAMAHGEAERGRPVAAVILEAAFTSAADVAQRHYWFLPMRLLMRDRYDNMSRIADIGAPLLVVHGDQDKIVPWSHGRRLLAAAREPVRAVWIAAAGHNDLHQHGALELERGNLARFRSETRTPDR